MTGDRLPYVALPPDDGDAAAVLAAARYWELPPAYVRRLARCHSTCLVKSRATAEDGNVVRRFHVC